MCEGKVSGKNIKTLSVKSAANNVLKRHHFATGHLVSLFGQV